MGKTKLFADSIAKKLKGAKTLDEVKDIAVEKGCELTDDELDYIAGGIDMPELPKDRVDCYWYSYTQQ